MSLSPVADTSFDSALTQGGELLVQGKLAEARVQLERAYKMHPENEKGRNLLGLTCFKLGDYEKAADIYEALVRANPVDPTLRVNLGLVYLKSQSFVQAVQEFRAATDLAPEHKKAHNYLGLAFAQMKDYANAREHFALAGSAPMVEKMDHALAEQAAQAEQEQQAPAWDAFASIDAQRQAQGGDGNGANWADAVPTNESPPSPSSSDASASEPVAAANEDTQAAAQQDSNEHAQQEASVHGLQVASDAQADAQAMAAVSNGAAYPEPFTEADAHQSPARPQGSGVADAAALEQLAQRIDEVHSYSNANGRAQVHTFRPQPGSSTPAKTSAPNSSDGVATGSPTVVVSEEIGLTDEELALRFSDDEDEVGATLDLSEADAVPSPVTAAASRAVVAARDDAEHALVENENENDDEDTDEDDAGQDDDEPKTSMFLRPDISALEALESAPSETKPDESVDADNEYAALEKTPTPEGPLLAVAQEAIDDTYVPESNPALAAEVAAAQARANAEREVEDGVPVSLEPEGDSGVFAAEPAGHPDVAPPAVAAPVTKTESAPVSVSVEETTASGPAPRPGTTLEAWIPARQVQDVPVGGTFDVRDDTVTVQISGHVWTRGQGLLAWQGGLEWQPDADFGAGPEPMFRVSGQGRAVFETGSRSLHAVELAGQRAVFRDSRVVSLSGSLGFERWALPGDAGSQALDLVRLEGQGEVLVSSVGPPRALPVGRDSGPVTVPLRHFLGWTGELSARLVQSPGIGEACVELTGEGVSFFSSQVG